MFGDCGQIVSRVDGAETRSEGLRREGVFPDGLSGGWESHGAAPEGCLYLKDQGDLRLWQCCCGSH